MVNSETYLESPVTSAPREGRKLATKPIGKSIAEIQSGPETGKPSAQIMLRTPRTAQVIAVEFQTIALANNHRNP